MPLHASGAGLGRARSLRVGAVVAVALAIAFGVWLLVRGSDGSSTPAVATTAAGTTTTTATTPAVKPLFEAIGVQALKGLAAGAGHPIYWAGPRPRVTYELTRTSDGRIYIRYLPKGVKIGDRHAAYLIVATYPVPNAYQAVRTAAKEKGAKTFALAGGGKAVFNRRAPTNVYFAYPGSDYQVEVYTPKPGRARGLVASGKIRPVG
jgi:hypothetical protein